VDSTRLHIPPIELLDRDANEVNTSCLSAQALRVSYIAHPQ